MDSRPTLTLAEQFAAAQDWWREAGVDHIYADATTNWLQDPEEEGEKRPLPVAAVQQKAEVQEKKPDAPPLGGDRESWPQSLDSFAPWWLAEPSLDIGGGGSRIAPRGAAGAKLMIMVLEPEAEDAEMLLSGPQGRLLASFMKAAALAPDDVYLASSLPRHTPHADWEGLAQRRLGDIILHHIGLVAPQRLLVFGRGILPLIGHGPAQTPSSLPEINHQGRNVPLHVERALDFMLARPAARSGFWQRWLDWTDS